MLGAGLGLLAISKSRTRYREDEGNQDRFGWHAVSPHVVVAKDLASKRLG
jgi:hypothetical protein